MRPRLYVADASSGFITVLNTTSDREIARVEIGAQATGYVNVLGMDISADDSELYVALPFNQSLAIINLHTLELSTTTHITADPVAVAAGRQGRAYVTTDEDWGYPRIIDTINHTEIGMITAAGQVYGGGVPAQAALAGISPDHRVLYVGDKLSPTSIYRFNVTTDNPTYLNRNYFDQLGDNLQDFEVGPNDTSIYVATGSVYAVQVLDPRIWVVLGSLPTGEFSRSVSLAQNGRIAFAGQSSPQMNNVIEFNASSYHLITSYPVSTAITMVRALPEGSNVYVITSPSVFSASSLEDLDTQPPQWLLGSSVFASNISATNVTLSWTGATDDEPIVAYRVYESIGPISKNGAATNFMPVSTVYNVTTANITSLVPNSAYLFKVEAYDGTSWSTGGPSVLVTTLPDHDPPTWPSGSGLFVLDIQPSLVDLYWTAALDNVGVVAYRIYQDDSFVGQVNRSAYFGNSYTASNVDPNATYTFRVEAGDVSDNWSVQGPSLTVTMPPESCRGAISCLVYESLIEGDIVPGGTGTILTTFRTGGQYPTRITSLTISGDLGQFTPSSSLPLYLAQGQKGNSSIIISIPRNASVGDHSITISVSWEYYSAGQWVAGPKTVTQGHILVYQTPPSNPPPQTPLQTSGLIGLLVKYSPILFIAYLATLAVALVLFFQNQHEKRKSLPAIPHHFGQYQHGTIVCTDCKTMMHQSAVFCPNCGVKQVYPQSPR